MMNQHHLRGQSGSMLCCGPSMDCPNPWFAHDTYMPYVHSSGVLLVRFYGLDLSSWKTRRHGDARFSMMKTAAVFNYKGKKLHTHSTCVVNRCQRKAAEILFRSTKCSGIGSVMVGAIFNLAKVDTVRCMFTATLSLFLIVHR